MPVLGLVLGASVLILFGPGPSQEGVAPYGIEVVDRATGRGIPLVELRTTNGILYVTDSAGRVAFDEPGLLGGKVWFHVHSHGYEPPRDGFGFEGVVLSTKPGGRVRLELERINIAQRLYRITGQGIYRDTILLGEEPPWPQPPLRGGVMGQDSVVTARLGERILWFWGDTNRARYPLGLFEVAGGWSLPPDAGGLDPDVGIDLHYYTGKDGFARAMCPIEGPGPTWIGGLMVVDGGGREILVAHYVRVESLGKLLERGIARWNAELEVLEKWRELPIETQLHPSGHPVPVRDGGRSWFVFPAPYPQVRVPATIAAIGDPAAYEGFTCLVAGSEWDPDSPEIERDAEGRVVWDWKPGTEPVGEEREKALVRRGHLSERETLPRLRDVETGEPVVAHNGSIRWNPHRRRWVWIVGESPGSSLLGEIWYAEADTLIGPWVPARKIVTHDDYSFYNVAQHDFLAKESGRILYFEGTYTRTFSGAKVPTPRYDYNQVMYRLDLDDPWLRLPVLVYEWDAGRRGSIEAVRAAGLQPHEAVPLGFVGRDSSDPGEIEGADISALPRASIVLGTERSRFED